MIWVMIRAIISRLFVVPFPGSHSDMLHLTSDSFAAEDTQHLLVLGPPGSGKSSLHKENVKLELCDIIDIRKISTPEAWRVEEYRALVSKKPIIVLDHFEHAFGSPAHDQNKWNLIERLLTENKTLHILSSVNPLSDIPSRLRLPGVHETGSQGKLDKENGNVEYSSMPLAADRPLDWASLLRGFALCYYRKPFARLKNTEEGDATAKLQHFQEEAAEDKHLHRLGEWVLGKNRELDGWGDADIVPQWLGLAKPYYQARWESCTLEEQLALFHLAKDGFLHAHHPEFPRLFLKGLVQLTPNLRLMNDSFRLFILSAGFKAQLDRFKHEQIHSTWKSLKQPLMLVLAVVVLFLFGTQEELKTSFNAVLGVLPFLLPILSELLGHMGQRAEGEQSS
ncbi:hypothetical protein [Nitrospira sp. M1]